MFKNGAEGEGVTTHTPLPGHTHRAARDTRGGQKLSDGGPKSHSSREPRSKVKRGNDFPPKKHSSQTVKEPGHVAEPSSSCLLPLVFRWGMRTWRGRESTQEAIQGQEHFPEGLPCAGVQAVHRTGRLAKGVRTGCPALFAKPWALALAVSFSHSNKNTLPG